MNPLLFKHVNQRGSYGTTATSSFTTRATFSSSVSICSFFCANRQVRGRAKFQERAFITVTAPEEGQPFRNGT
jgi:hypothetical protein